MLKNYLITTFRNMFKTKVFTLINILGLSIGMTACLLILHYVNFENSYDKFNVNHENIYRLRYERTDDAGNTVRFASCTPPAAARIRGKYPEVEKIGRMVKTKGTVSYEDQKFLEERLFYAESELLDILKIDLVEGDRKTGIAEPNTVFISRSIAKKYFGDINPTGMSINIDNRHDYQIMGIFEDIPHNSHLKFDILMSWKNLEALYGEQYTEAWGHTGAYTYLVAHPDTDPLAFEKKLQPLIETECPWLKEYNMTIDLKMQPLTDIHLTSHFMQEYEMNGDRDAVNILVIIAVFIIVIAWVNYINLSTACSLRRAREVGLRKVVGATKGQLISQFFFEVVIINIISIISACGLISLSLPYFNQITGTPADYLIWTQGWFWLLLAGMFSAGVFLSGFYPVIALSSFKPVTVLKGKLAQSVRGINLRKILVVFQFAVGLFLIIATITVYQQISYMQGQDLGFNIDQKLVIKAPRVRDEAYGSKFDAFKETLLSQSNIEMISHSSEVPGRQIYWDNGGIFRVGEDQNQGKNYQIIGIDYDFADAYELRFVAGRNFSIDFPSDTAAILLNETSVTYMGFEDAPSAIGKQVNYWGNIYTIVGVVEDFHQQSLREEFEPHLLRYLPYGQGALGMMTIKLNPANIRETVSMIKTQYDEFFPGNPFDYFFLDEYFDQQYESDELFGRIYSLFTFLAIIITILGLYGLSSYSVAQLTKEIGIRKILGASVNSIFRLSTKESMILLGIAAIIAWPVAYIAMNRWLEGYAFRVGIGIEIFILASLLIALIAILTISYQVLKAALANPVDAIKYE